MAYIDSGKQEGANVQIGGVRHGDQGYFIKPTLFTNVTPEMKIVREEIFGPVGVVIKFKTEEGWFPVLFFLWDITKLPGFIRGHTARERHDLWTCKPNLHREHESCH